MFTSKKVRKLFHQKANEEIYKSFSPEDVSEALGFKDALRLAYRLLYNPEWKEEPQLYAIKLILLIKFNFSSEWERDWRNEAFLGSAYNIVLGDDNNYDERYKAYSRAFKKSGKTAYPELLIELARCADGPEDPPVTCDQAIKWLRESIEIEPYSDAAGLLSLFYFRKNDKIEYEHWKKKALELRALGKTAPEIEPSFVRE